MIAFWEEDYISARLACYMSVCVKVHVSACVHTWVWRFVTVATGSHGKAGELRGCRLKNKLPLFFLLLHLLFSLSTFLS